jgi:hypothetical protein
MGVAVDPRRHRHIVAGLTHRNGELEPVRNEVPVFRHDKQQFRPPGSAGDRSGILSAA